MEKTQQVELVYELIVTENVAREALEQSGKVNGWLTFSFSVYLVGLLGLIVSHRHFLLALIAIELMYLGAVTSFVLYAAGYEDPRGYVIGLLVLVFSACESAIGLGILIVLHRFDLSTDFTDFQHLGG